MAKIAVMVSSNPERLLMFAFGLPPPLAFHLIVKIDRLGLDPIHQTVLKLIVGHVI